MFLEEQAFARCTDGPAPKKAARKRGEGGGVITVCILCQMAFPSPAFYRRHLRLLHPDPASSSPSDKVPCPHCGKGVRRRLLPAHKRLKHRNTPPAPPTTATGKHHQKGRGRQQLPTNAISSSSEEVDRDRSQEGVGRVFVCSLCPKAFSIKSSLQRHLSCHSGEKPFLCGLCGRGYTRRSVLQLHVQQVHEERKPFECGACGLCFSQKGNLQAHHRRKHTPQRPPSPVRKGTTTNSNKKNKKQPPTNTTTPSTLHSYASKVKAIVSRGVQRTDVKYPAPLPSSKGASKYSEPVRTPNEYSEPSSSTKYLEPAPSTKRFSKYSELIHTPNKYSEPSPSTKYLEPSTKRFNKYSEPIHTPNKYSEPSPSTKSLGKYSQPLRVFSEYSEPATVQSSSSSVDSSGLSDSSSGGEEGADVLPDLDILLLEGGGWEEYMLADCELPMGKSNCCELLPKSGGDLYGWTDDCPLFTAEDLDAIGEISGNVHGPLDGMVTVKQEPRDELELLDEGNRGVPQQRSTHRGYYVQA